MKNKLAVSAKPLARGAGRRLFALLAVCVMTVGLAACGGQKTGGSKDIKPVTVEREPEPQALQTANEATTIALRQYIYARLATEAFLTADASSMTAGELSELADELFLAWENARLFSSAAAELTDQAVSLLEAPAVKRTGAAGQPQVQCMTLAAAPFNAAAVAYAAESGRKVDPQTWAENLTKQYDALKGAKRYQQLAQQLGTDAKTAYEQMALAQKIIRNAAELEEAEGVVNAYTESLHYLQALKTTSKVAMLGWSMAATGGGSVALLEGAGLLVGGVDCIVDVAETGSTLVLGEDNQVAVAFGDIKEKLGPVSSLIGLVTLNPSDIGKKAKDTTEALVYITDSLVDLFYEDKIMGIKVEGLSEQAVSISGQVIETGAKAALEAAGFLYPKAAKALSQLVGLWEPQPEVMVARMDALVSQMAELERAAGITEQAQPEPGGEPEVTPEPGGASEATPGPGSAESAPPIAAGDVDIFGRYTVAITAEDGGTDSITVMLSDAGGGRVLWQTEEDEYEEDEYEEDDAYAGRAIMSYNESTNTLHWEEDDWTIHVVFSGSGNTVTGSGYMSGILWEQSFYVTLSLTKVSG